MHLLSRRNHSEFLACPQLVRFDYAEGHDGFEPALLIKASTLLLKYIIMGVPIQIAFTMQGDRLILALNVRDDGNDGGILWSVVEHQEELDGIIAFARGEQAFAFLFNEIAVNVSWSTLPAYGTLDQLASWATAASLGCVNYSEIKSSIAPLLDSLHTSDGDGEGWLTLKACGQINWNPVHNQLVTTAASTSLIDLFDHNEGHQQEQLAIWLTDNLQPSGTWNSPQIPKDNSTRELTDILLSHEFGAVLIESKTLGIFAREQLPDRAKLKRNISSHVNKAFRQLRGALKVVKSGVPIMDIKGKNLSVEREKPAHAIVLIPDLDLIENRGVYGLEFTRKFMEETGGFPHLLDISELLRVVQAAEIIAAESKTLTPMMAFDYYLMQRAEKAIEANTLCIEVLLRRSDNNVIE